MTELKPIEIAALGRPFSLGTLYDVRSDMLIPGFKLWDNEQLKNNIEESVNWNTQFEIITEDSLQEKSKALGVEGSMKLSLLCGLIEASGSAKYVDDFLKTSHVTRITLQYHSTTKFRELTMDHLGKGKLNHPDLFDSNIATHVVTGITYGVDAFFVFDRTLSKEQNKKEAHGELAAVIKKLKFATDINGEAKLDLKQNEQNFVDKLNCKFYGDFILEANPGSFEDAIKVYIELPKLLRDKQQSVVPKKIHLYPLHLLDNKAMKIVRDISSHVIDDCITFFQKLHELETRVLDLQNSKVFNYFSHMKKKLIEFATRLSKLESVVKKHMVVLLPKVRDEESKESELHDLFKNIDSTSFNQQRLESWIEDREKEVFLMEQFIKNLTADTQSNITIGTSSLDKILGDLDYDYILCLSFRFIDNDDQQLTDMNNYLKDQTVSNDQRNSSPRFRIQDIVSPTRTILRQFIEFAAANRDKSNITFVVNEEYPSNGFKQTQLVLYENGSEKENFKTPSKPNIPYATAVTCNSIALEWEDEQAGSEEIKNYKIWYSRSIDGNPSEEWNHVETTDNTKKGCLLNLASGASFICKVQSVNRIGLSPISDKSQSIKTLESINVPIDLKWKSNAITIAGGNGKGQQMNQLYLPWSISIDDDKTIYVVDYGNDRIVEWKKDSTIGRIVAGGNGKGNGNHQLTCPTKVIIDKINDCFIIADRGNKRVVRWPRQNGHQGQIIINNVQCRDIVMHKNEYLYVCDNEKHEVRRWKIGESQGVIVAGGNGKGNLLNQLNSPHFISIDEDETIYVSDYLNHRVMKWIKGAKEGIIVAGGQNEGNSLKQLYYPLGIVVDRSGTLYVSDHGNHRIVRWLKNAKEGTIIAGGNNEGNQLNGPVGLSFDDENNLYIAHYGNHRIQKYFVDK